MMLNGERLAEKASQYGISLNTDLIQKLDFYAAYLVEYNQNVNLTSITQAEEMEDKHFIDSLLLAKSRRISGSMVDVGSGAGFPGLVVALSRPDVKLCLMEPTGKRVVFLQKLAEALGVSCEIVKERAEEAGRKQWRESFDVACARAVAALPQLCEYCLPLVKPGGWFVAMKGSDETEVEAAARAIARLGGRLEEIERFALPGGEKRALVWIKKVQPTPAAYPRNGGVIRKRPL